MNKRMVLLEPQTSKVLYGAIQESDENDCEAGWGVFFAIARIDGELLDLSEFDFDREDLVSRESASKKALSWLKRLALERGLELKMVEND